MNTCTQTNRVSQICIRISPNYQCTYCTRVSHTILGTKNLKSNLFEKFQHGMIGGENFISAKSDGSHTHRIFFFFFFTTMN